MTLALNRWPQAYPPLRLISSSHASLNSGGGSQVAVVHCAKDLDDDQRYLVAKKLQEMTGQKNIKIKTNVDESLIAGFVVDYGSAQIDLSIKGQLEEVAQELVAGVSAVA